MHPLDGAYEQITGAREHLDLLKPEIVAFSSQVSNSVSLKYKMGTINIGGRRRRVPIGEASMVTGATASPRVSRLIGEVVQNIRTALDYLVYELACLDAKEVVDGTQFPVADTEEKFKQLLGRHRLKVLTPEHIAALKRLQPFEGCDWTKRLVVLSNPDKHRHLTITRSQVGIQLDSRITQAILAGGHVPVESYATIHVAFSDGLPVVESLEQLLLMAIKTLDAFKPEFK